jgi:hypothetical protein
LTDDRAFGEDEVAGPYNRPKLRKLTFSDDRQHVGAQRSTVGWGGAES